LRLAPIVRQLGDLLPQAPEPAEISNPSFETPFGRQAEIELARIREKQKAPPPLLRQNPARPLFPRTDGPVPDEIDFTPSDRPKLPLEILRKQNLTKISSPGEEEGRPINNVREDNFLVPPEDLASPELPHQDPEKSREDFAVTVLEENKLSPALAQVTPSRSLEEGANRRAAIERLQELFLSEDEFDGPGVTQEILKLPKILGVLVLRDQAVLGMRLPEGFNPKAVLTLNRLLKQLVQFTQDFGAESFLSLTISAREQITLVPHGPILILVIHRGRLVPGVREKLVECAKALDRLYAAFEC
jgi:hypothetical protein